MREQNLKEERNTEYLDVHLEDRCNRTRNTGEYVR